MILEPFALPTLFVPVVGKFIVRKISFNSLTIFPLNSTSPYAFPLGLVIEAIPRKRKYILAGLRDVILASTKDDWCCCTCNGTTCCSNEMPINTSLPRCQLLDSRIHLCNDRRYNTTSTSLRDVLKIIEWHIFNLVKQRCYISFSISVRGSINFHGSNFVLDPIKALCSNCGIFFLI